MNIGAKMAILPPDPRFVLQGDMKCIHSACFRINTIEEQIYTGSSDGIVYCWDLNTNREFLQLRSGDDPCLAIHFPSYDNLIVQQKCSVFNSYKLTESDWILDDTFDSEFCLYCRFQILTPTEILIPLKDSKIGILSLKTFKLEAKLDPTDLNVAKNIGEPMVIKPIEDGSLVLIGYEGGRLLLWDVKERKVLNSLDVQSEPMALDFDEHFRRGVIAGPSNQIQVFNLTKGQGLSERNKIPLRNEGVSVTAIRSDSKIIATGGWDSKTRIFSWKNMRSLAVLDFHKDTVQDIAYSSMKVKSYDDKYLMATAGKDGYVALWDIYN